MLLVSERNVGKRCEKGREGERNGRQRRKDKERKEKGKDREGR